MNETETEEKIDIDKNTPKKAELDKPIKQVQQYTTGKKQVEQNKTGKKQVEHNTTGKKQATKTVVVKTVKQGAGLVSKAGDFIGRLGTLMVMIVTSINTGTIMVTSFLEEVYWKGAVHAVLLAFVHLPVIVFMIWFMCKARMQWLYSKVRPSRPGEPIVVADVENETIVYEEIVEVQEDVSDSANGQTIANKKASGTPVTARKGADKMKQLKIEEKLNGGMRFGEQVNNAFEMG